MSRLKTKYEAIRSQILGGSSLLLLLEVFSRIQRAILSTMSSGIDHGVSTDCSALVVPLSHSDGHRGGHGVRGGQGGRTRGRMGGRGGRSGPRSCTH
ncbi:unnamed protein product [Ilex paraguariensis]|uniref:Uncharacterized protein n=1 Tax=Ilex paraguariensis TaxID=185542 RepID=A0ABC8SZW1_9AQUA